MFCDTFPWCFVHFRECTDTEHNRWYYAATDRFLQVRMRGLPVKPNGGNGMRHGRLVALGMAIALLGVVATQSALAQQASACVTGGAVSDAANTGLVSDCEALLEARDTLAGTGSLNWSENTPIAQWDGITLRGTPEAGGVAEHPWRRA